MNTRVAIVGASGYAGEELLRILLKHPNVTITCITSRQNAGRQIGEFFPRFVNGTWHSQPLTPMTSPPRRTSHSSRSARTRGGIRRAARQQGNQGHRYLRRLQAQRHGYLQAILQKRPPGACPPPQGRLRIARALSRPVEISPAGGLRRLLCNLGPAPHDRHAQGGNHRNQCH